MTARACAIAVIGFSEAGQAIGGGLAGAGADRVCAYDLRFDDAAVGADLKTRAVRLAVEVGDSAAAACSGADVIVSAVTAGAALDVARSVAGFIQPNQIFLDINSISPAGKQAGAEAIEAAGAAYVDAAVMGPVGPSRHETPMLFAGGEAERLAEILRPLGMRIEIAGKEVGAAAAVKMCRSIVMKGLEALMIECLVTARAHGVEDRVIASLGESFPGVDWSERSSYMLGRVLAHGARRAEEMRFAAETVRAAGLEPVMAAAAAKRQQWVADLGLGDGGKAGGSPSECLDALTADLRREGIAR